MSRHPLRLLLPLALTSMLIACGDEPEVAESSAVSTTAGSGENTPKSPPPPKLAEVRTPYERALRQITSGGSFRFESQATLTDGGEQYATGASDAQNYGFSLRTLPKPADLDGNWVFQLGRYYREGPTGYDVHILSPAAHALLTEALFSLPQDESSVLAGEAGAGCTLRRVDLAKQPQLLSRYRNLAACVDETNAKLVHIESEWQSGEKLSADLSAHGEAVQIAKVEAFDWSQEYPRR